MRLGHIGDDDLKPCKRGVRSKGLTEAGQILSSSLQGTFLVIALFTIAVSKFAVNLSIVIIIINARSSEFCSDNSYISYLEINERFFSGKAPDLIQTTTGCERRLFDHMCAHCRVDLSDLVIMSKQLGRYRVARAAKKGLPLP